MRILFVRHGEPDYKNDCLTETGKLQAQAAALRLENEGISEIYASPMGRARETAGYTAERLGLPITILDYMHEIDWGGLDVPQNGHPWTLSDWLLEEGFDLSRDNWREHPYFKNNVVTEYYDMVSQKFDVFLEEQGYRHEKGRFFCTADDDKTIAVFSHGGSGACVLANILNQPFPYNLCVMPYEFTSIISVNIPTRPGTYVHPIIELYNDAAHIRGLSKGLALQKEPDPIK